MITRMANQPNAFRLQSTSLLKQVVLINCMLVFLLALSTVSEFAAFVGGAILIFYISATCLKNPNYTFYLFFGTKFMVDAFWFINYSFPIGGKINLLYLSLLPLVLASILGPRISLPQMKKVVLVAGVYILWISLSMVFNDVNLDFDLLVRQSGIFFGLLMGAIFLKSEEQFQFLMKIIFISSIIPALLSLLQIVPTFSGLPIFHIKLDSIREIRNSGIYYDPATAGMVNIVSFFSNSFLILLEKKIGYKLILQMGLLPVNIALAISGQTRSILFIMIMISIFLFFQKGKNLLILLPLFGAVIFFSLPYLQKVEARIKKDSIIKSSIVDIFQENEYRTMYSGRVGIWQDILNEYESGSFPQKMFGKGLSSNAHSSYFFLLLQIGTLGLIFYLAFNFWLIIKLFRVKGLNLMRNIALLSLASFLLIGISASTVIYSSFQWIIYLIIAGVLTISRRKKAIIRKLLAMK